MGSFETESCVSWLFHIVHVTIQYKEEKMKYSLRIFGIPLRKNKEENEKKRKTKSEHRKRKVKKQKRLPKERTDKNERASKKELLERTIEKENHEEDFVTSECLKEDRIEPLKTESVRDGSTLKSKNMIVSRVNSTVNKKEERSLFFFRAVKKLKHIIRSIREKIRRIPIVLFQWKVKVRNLNHKKKQIFSFIKAKETKNSFRKLKKRLFEILKYVAPKQMHGYVRFGTGDPCNTGQILGAISIARAYWNTQVSIYPVFEEKIFETDLKAHGRMRVIRFLWIGGILYFDKEIKKSIADIKQIKEELNG